MIKTRPSTLASSFAMLGLLITCSSSWAETTLPFIGKSYTYQYDGFIAEDTFVSADTIDFIVTEGPVKGLKGEVKYQAREIRPGVYLIYWQEKDGGTVTHIDDFTNGVSYSNYTTPDLKFYTMTGSIKEIKAHSQEHKH